MSYEPTNWKDGDLVTSAKLNKIEQGIAASGGIRVVHLTMSGLPSGGGNVKSVSSSTAPSIQLDITPNELMDAFENEEIVVIIDYDISRGGGSQALASFYYDGTTYSVMTEIAPTPLTSSDPDEYFTYNPNSESSDDDDSGDGGLK